MATITSSMHLKHVNMSYVYKIQTISDLLDIVTTENHKRLSDDIARLLQSMAKIKDGPYGSLITKLPIDQSIMWTDDGVVKAFVSLSVLDS